MPVIIENIKFVVNHGGYGNAGDNGVERTDLVEMWGYFMGREYAHRRYGPTRHSELIAFSPGSATFANSWYGWNENSGLYFSLFEHNHIPAAFLHDLLDDNIYNQASGRNLDENDNVVFDRISGYTISNIYNFLDGSTTSAATLINKLSTVLPPNTENTTGNYNLLKSYYGY